MDSTSSPSIPRILPAGGPWEVANSTDTCPVECYRLGTTLSDNKAIYHDLAEPALQHPGMDVINGHQSHSQWNSNSSNPKFGGKSRRCSRTTFIACYNCREIKKKCSGGDPCEPCIQKGKAHTCVRAGTRKSPVRPALNQSGHLQPMFPATSALTHFVAGPEPTPGAAPVLNDSLKAPSTSSQVSGDGGSLGLPCYCPMHGYITRMEFTADSVSTPGWRTMGEPARYPHYQWADPVPDTTTLNNGQHFSPEGLNSVYATNATEPYDFPSAGSAYFFPSYYY